MNTFCLGSGAIALWPAMHSFLFIYYKPAKFNDYWLFWKRIPPLTTSLMLLGCVNGKMLYCEQNGIMHDCLKRLIQWTCWMASRNYFSFFSESHSQGQSEYVLLCGKVICLFLCVKFSILFLNWCSQTVLRMLYGKGTLYYHFVSISDCHCIKTNGLPIFCWRLILSLIGFWLILHCFFDFYHNFFIM